MTIAGVVLLAAAAIVAAVGYLIFCKKIIRVVAVVGGHTCLIFYVTSLFISFTSYSDT